MLCVQTVCPVPSVALGDGMIVVISLRKSDETSPLTSILFCDVLFYARPFSSIAGLKTQSDEQTSLHALSLILEICNIEHTYTALNIDKKHGFGSLAEISPPKSSGTTIIIVWVFS